MIPAWANQEISNLLPKLRAGGEKHICEFKEGFPGQAHELAKEVAAFATSGGGMILIGVRDDGSVAGLNEAEQDGLYHRAQSITRLVQPPVKHDVVLCYDGAFILVIYVRDQQPEPVYYYDHRPYIRDGRTSRPAAPEEVKASVWAHPSSEQRRRSEELKHELAKQAAAVSALRTEQADAVAMAQAETIAQIGRDFAARSR